MQNNNCPNCNGQMVLSMNKTKWICPYCGSQFLVQQMQQGQPGDSGPKFNADLLNFRFRLEGELDRKNSGACLESLAECLNKYADPSELEAFMRKELITGEDVAMEGVNDKLFQTAKDRIAGELMNGERVSVIVDQGVFSHGKDFHAVTNKRVFIVRKKKASPVAYKDIRNFTFANSLDSPNW